MQVKSMASAILIFILTLALAGCGGAAQQGKQTGGSQPTQTASAQPRQISIGTAQAPGTFYVVGVAIANVISKYSEGLSASAEETGGAVQNMMLLDRKEIDVGFAGDLLAFLGLHGKKPYEKKLEYQAAWYLFDAPYHIVTTNKTGIKTAYDLKGKRVSVGAAGSLPDLLTRMVFEAHGYTASDVKLFNIGYEQSIDALLDGTIDAFALNSAIPAPQIEQIRARGATPVVVSLDWEAMKKSIKDVPVETTRVAPGVYGPEEVLVWSAPSHAWVRSDLPEDVVYKMVKAVMEHKDEIVQAHPAAKAIRPISSREAQLLEASGASVHPGAIKYAKEVKAW